MSNPFRFIIPACLAVAICQLMAQQPAATVRLEPYVLLPEPSALRSPHSIVPAGAVKTVLTPARQTLDKLGVAAYSADEFKKLGISKETFAQKARAAADARLAQMQPEFIKDDTGTTRYAVFRGESPLIASLVAAPSLIKNFTSLFGKDVWAALPDRNSLYIFPAKPEMLAEFADDLAERYNTNPYAASCEVFLIREGKEPAVVASFGD